MPLVRRGAHLSASRIVTKGSDPGSLEKPIGTASGPHDDLAGALTGFLGSRKDESCFPASNVRMTGDENALNDRNRGSVVVGLLVILCHFACGMAQHVLVQFSPVVFRDKDGLRHRLTLRPQIKEQVADAVHRQAGLDCPAQQQRLCHATRAPWNVPVVWADARIVM